MVARWEVPGLPRNHAIRPAAGPLGHLCNMDRLRAEMAQDYARWLAQQAETAKKAAAEAELAAKLSAAREEEKKQEELWFETSSSEGPGEEGPEEAEAPLPKPQEESAERSTAAAAPAPVEALAETSSKRDSEVGGTGSQD